MATEVVRFVNTASPGGDGTTNNTSGSTAAYKSLSAALSAEFSARGDLVTADEQLTIKVTGGADTARINQANDWKTSSTCYIKVIAEGDDAAGPVWSTSKYRYSISFAGGVSMGTLNGVEHIRFEGVQFENPNTGSTVAGFSLSPSNNDNDIRFTGCYVRAPSATSATAGLDLVVAGGTGTKQYVVANCVIEGWGTGVDLAESSVGKAAVYNNTFVNCTTAVDASSTGGTCYFINNLFSGCTTPISGGAAGDTCDTNATDQASLGTGLPTGTGNRVSQTFTFLAAGDYHLDTSDAGAKAHGSDLSADTVYSFSTDMDGDSRSGTWDIGVDQTAAVAGSGSGFYYMRRRR